MVKKRVRKPKQSKVAAAKQELLKEALTVVIDHVKESDQQHLIVHRKDETYSIIVSIARLPITVGGITYRA